MFLFNRWINSRIDAEMFYHESGKPIYFAVKRSKVRVTRHRKTVPACVFCTLVSAGFFSSSVTTFIVVSSSHSAALSSAD